MLSRDDLRNWRMWAGEKLKKQDPEKTSGVINLFPGWAARRYSANTTCGKARSASTPFDVEVFVSGFVNNRRSPTQVSRSQRAFIRLAKGFAALPKLANDSDPTNIKNTWPGLSSSTEDLLEHVKLPPLPSEISDNYEIDALEYQLRAARTTNSLDDSGPAASTSSPFNDSIPIPSLPSSKLPPPQLAANHISPEALRRMHFNLESRLHLFWTSVLPNRVVRLHLLASPHPSPREAMEMDSGQYTPLRTQDIVTGPDGSFQTLFRVKWEELCQHPLTLHIAFGEPKKEHDLLVLAELLPNPGEGARSENHRSRDVTSVPHGPPSAEQSCDPLRIPVTHCSLRVISDIDDTVKLAGVSNGPRAVFHNVFVKELEDGVIPGMAEWYSSMWKRGIRFHYVSNGPYEVLPILHEFFRKSQLPHGSIRLRSYAGRSLFNGLLSAPATRKRAGVIDILNSFPESQFLLIGDSGEQDLELYADLARELPGQILGVFIRDVDTGPRMNDPTGWKVMGASNSQQVSNTNFTSASFPNKNDLDETQSRPLAKRSLSAVLSSGVSSFLKGPPASSKSLPTPTRTGEGVLSPGPPISSVRCGSSPPAALPRKYFLGTSVLSDEPGSLPERGVPVTSTLGYGTPHGAPYRLNVSLAPPSNGGQDLKVVTEPPRPISPPTLRPPDTHARPGSMRSTASTASLASPTYGLTEAEKRRKELQARVHRARIQMPGHVVLRIFREPQEIIEMDDILKRMVEDIR